MKTILITLVTTTTVTLTALKEDAAEALWTALLFAFIMLYIHVSERITLVLRKSRIKRVREANSLRRARRLNRSVYTEVWIEKAATEVVGY